jgi:hypothetical protein
MFCTVQSSMLSALCYVLSVRYCAVRAQALLFPVLVVPVGAVDVVDGVG